MVCRGRLAKMTNTMSMRHVMSLPGLLAVFVALGAPASLWAQPSSPPRRVGIIHTRTYEFKEAGAFLPYDLYISRNYRDDVPAPLLVALHPNSALPQTILLYQGLRQLADARGYIAVAPMGFTTQGGFGNPTRGGGRRNPADPENIDELSEQDVLHVVAVVRAEFNIDPKRIYLMGHSMGGGGTWHLGIKYPELWAALAPVAPSIARSPSALEAIPNMPVILVQGALDPLVASSRVWAAKMKELGMPHEYLEVPTANHISIIKNAPETMQRIFDFFENARKEAGSMQSAR
jgi:poly(3-hydroxybutyrate) depolymerase